MNARKSDPKVANEIISQLGGQGALSAALGAKDYIFDDRHLRFRIQNCRRYSHIEIGLNGADLYDVRLYRVARDLRLKNDETIKDVECSELRGLIEQKTGLLWLR